MLTFEILHPRAHDLLGYIPEFLSASDLRPAKEQFNERYAHGGGWRPLKGWAVLPITGGAKYPGDPIYRPIAKATLRDETIYVYQHAWVSIVQKDGTFEMSRMD